MLASWLDQANIHLVANVSTDTNLSISEIFQTLWVFHWPKASLQNSTPADVMLTLEGSHIGFQTGLDVCSQRGS